MTQEQADALKERIESGDFPLFVAGAAPAARAGCTAAG